MSAGACESPNRREDSCSASRALSACMSVGGKRTKEKGRKPRPVLCRRMSNDITHASRIG